MSPRKSATFSEHTSLSADFGVCVCLNTYFPQMVGKRIPQNGFAVREIPQQSSGRIHTAEHHLFSRLLHWDQFRDLKTVIRQFKPVLNNSRSRTTINNWRVVFEYIICATIFVDFPLGAFRKLRVTYFHLFRLLEECRIWQFGLW